MSLFTSLSNEVKLFFYEQELATVNATIETLIGYGVTSEVMFDHGQSLLKKRKKELEVEIAKIQELYNNFIEANRRYLDRDKRKIVSNEYE